MGGKIARPAPAGGRPGDQAQSNPIYDETVEVVLWDSSSSPTRTPIVKRTRLFDLLSNDD